jgi:regulator of protease activity HflC (stomatin/prohibitin superfamily)
MELSLTTVILVVLVLLAVVTAAKGIRTVPQGEVWTVQRFGAFTRLLQPGLNFIIPYIDTVGRRMNVQEVVLDIPEQSVITRDNATVNVDGIVYFRVMDPAKAAYQVQDMNGALSALAMTNIRAVIGEMDLDQTLSSRDRINSQLLAILDGATDPLGREGQPRRDPQDRATGEPDPRHEPADDRRARAPRHRRQGRERARGRGQARRGREAGADPRGRGSARGRQARPPPPLAAAAPSMPPPAPDSPWTRA